MNRLLSFFLGLVLFQNSLFAITPLLEEKVGQAFAEFSVTSNQDTLVKKIKAIQEDTNATPKEIFSAFAQQTGLSETTVGHLADYTRYAQRYNIPMDEATANMANMIVKSSPTGSNFLGEEVSPVVLALTAAFMGFVIYKAFIEDNEEERNNTRIWRTETGIWTATGVQYDPLGIAVSDGR